MAKKKTKKKNAKLKKSAAKKPARKASRKNTAKKKPTPRRPVAKTKAPTKKAASRRVASAPRKRVPARNQTLDIEAVAPQGRRSRSAGQSGDLQGLSSVEAADSESVDELVEEGNAFEANVVDGVESAGDDAEKEVRTHEVPEDDVPDEYLDEK